MKKNILIFGSVALLGVGAFIFFRKKNTELTVGANALENPELPSGQGTTPEEVEAITVKVSTARDLTKTICDLKKQYKITTDQMNDFMNFTSTSQGNSIFSTQISQTASEMMKFQLARKKAVLQVSDSIKRLKELGYKEDNCKMVKIA
jgi:hypothetical protein